MPVPQEILAVPRPKNSIVKAYGKNKDHYSVICREKSQKKNGRYVPVNGPTIGHIIGGVYVPLNPDVIQNISMKATDYKTWGSYVLCDRVFKDILEDLKKFYSPSDAVRIYVMAILRVCKPGIRDYRLKDEYDQSWLSELYPKAGLCKNTVSSFQSDLGRTCSVMTAFMHDRCTKVSLDDHLIIDGTLKTDDSDVNDFAHWSRKARLKGRQDISVLYAYDQETGEPVCSQCFPGDMIDAKSYKNFLKTNQIEKGIVVVDKGFPIEEAYDYFAQKPNLHFLNPLKRSAKAAKEFDLYNFEGILSLKSDGPSKKKGAIYYKKVRDIQKDGSVLWYYSYKDVYQAMEEEEDWSNNYPDCLKKKEIGLSFEEALEKNRETFGTIILESDLEMSPEEAYLVYDSRWDIEIMMRFYKTACEFDKTEVHSDYSVMGSEFIDFLSVLLTYRLKELFEHSEKLREIPYIDILEDLQAAKMFRKAGSEWEMCGLPDKKIQLLQEVGLVAKEEKRKPGRPKSDQPKPDKPKRKPGRPRTRPLPDPNKPKRKPGRPKGSKNKKKKEAPATTA